MLKYKLHKRAIYQRNINYKLHLKRNPNSHNNCRRNRTNVIHNENFWILLICMIKFHDFNLISVETLKVFFFFIFLLEENFYSTERKFESTALGVFT